MSSKVGPMKSNEHIFDSCGMLSKKIMRSLFTLLIIIVSCVCCSIPFILGLKIDYGDYDEKNAPIVHSVQSESFKLAVVGCLAVSLPVTLEYILDINLLSIKSNLQKGFFERGLLLGVLLLSNLVILTYVIPSGASGALNLIFNLHYLVIIASAFSYLYHLGSPVFNCKTTIVSAISTCLGIICQNYYMFVPFRKSVALLIILYLAYVIGYITLFYLAYKWHNFIRNMTKDDMNIDQYGSSVYVISLVIIYIGYLVLSSVDSHQLEDTSPQILSGRCYIDGSFTILIAILPGRMARQESIQAKVRLNLYLNLHIYVYCI